MTAVCKARYERPGGALRGDRIVRCHLPAGHPGEHEEAETEVTWPDAAPKEAPMADPTMRIAEWYDNNPVVRGIADAAYERGVAAGRKQAAEQIAEKIEDNVRNEDPAKQDRGGFVKFSSRMAYVAGHDKAAAIARQLVEPPAAVRTEGDTRP